tara:strand:- start:416 stop:1651 length:1236 start_codon:yes stop_codon:yes gene_type:complete
MVGDKCVLGFFVVMLLIPGVYSISTDLRETYQPGETMITEIKGNFLEPLTAENVEFRRGHVVVPFEYDLGRLSDKYFLWAIMPRKENNYSLVLKDVVTTVEGRVEEIDYEQNFSTVGELVDYSVKPGFKLVQESFTIEVELNEDVSREIELGFQYEWRYNLKPGKNLLPFDLTEVKRTELYNLLIGKYTLPVYVLKKEDVRNLVSLPKLRFNPRIIESVVLVGGEPEFYPFQIINSGEEGVDLSFEFDEELFLLDWEDDFQLGVGEIADFNLSLKGDLEGEFNESIYVRTGEHRINLPIIIRFTEDKDEVSTPYLEGDLNEDLYYCSELDGTVCSADESCDKDGISSLDGACCLGTCVEKEGGSLAWIGWLIGAIVLIGGLIVWAKYRKSKVGGRGKVVEKRVKKIESEKV